MTLSKILKTHTQTHTFTMFTVHIYDADGDLTKRWYVYYSFRHPVSKKMVRQTPIYYGVNRYKTIKERKAVLKLLYNKVVELLENGYNPYADNSKFDFEQTRMMVADAFVFVLDLRKTTLSQTSFSDFRLRVTKFETFLKKNSLHNKYIDEINKRVVTVYLNEILKTSSARNRNNARSNLSMFFQTLAENNLVADNFVKDINILKSEPERNKTYSTTQTDDLFQWLEENDKMLLLFIQFISYNYLRPVEVCRLKIKDINIKDKLIYIRAKNKLVKTKILPQIMIDSLPDLSKYEAETFLFTPTGYGADWTTAENDKRDYFSKRFKKVKDIFKLGKDYGLYSFRHTFITKLYQSFVKNSTPFEAKSRLMLITGHATMDALEKYLRDIDAQLPDDYSDNL